MQCVARLIHCHIPEERSYCRKARIPAAGAVETDRLDVNQEIADQISIQILDLKFRWDFASLCIGEVQEQAKGVPITCDCILAGLHLGAKTVRKEPLEQRRERWCLHFPSS